MDRIYTFIQWMMVYLYKWFWLSHWWANKKLHVRGKLWNLLANFHIGSIIVTGTIFIPWTCLIDPYALIFMLHWLQRLKKFINQKTFRIKCWFSSCLGGHNYWQIFIWLDVDITYRVFCSYPKISKRSKLGVEFHDFVYIKSGKFTIILFPIT